MKYSGDRGVERPKKLPNKMDLMNGHMSIDE